MDIGKIKDWLRDAWFGIFWYPSLGFCIPKDCYSCDFHLEGVWCTSAERRHLKRFPFVHNIMNKEQGGWLVLPYKDNCVFYCKDDCRGFTTIRFEFKDE